MNSKTGSAVPARNAAIDIARGIAILLVFLGHIKLTPTSLRLWLWSFHMPLFFVCSGLVFSTRKYPRFFDYLKQQIRSLVVPYFTLGISLYLLICLADMFEGALSGSPVEWSWTFKEMLISLVLSYRLHDHYFSLWFLTTLFAGKLVFWFIHKAVRERPFVYLALSFLFCLLQSWVFNRVQGFYWSLDIVPSCLAFLSLGYFLKTCPKIEVIYDRRFIPLATVLSLALAIVSYRVTGGHMVGLYRSHVGDPVMYFLAAAVGSWMVLAFSHYLEHNRLLEFLGKNSLVLYAYQNSFCIPVCTMIMDWLAVHHSLVDDPITRWLFIFCTSVMLGSLLVVIVNRFFPWFLGKRRSRTSA